MAVTIDSPGRSIELARSAVGTAMRGTVEGLGTPRPLIEQLPAMFQEDAFCQRLMSAFDDVLAPIFSTLDCWDSYLDAQLAPDDFVDWLASWVGVEVDETWPLERRRQLVEGAVALYRIRGTAAGLAAHVRLYAGTGPEIEESGACAWSETANTPLPGSAQPHLAVRLLVPDPGEITRTTVERIISTSRPAHLPFTLEIATGEGEPMPNSSTESDESDGKVGAGSATMADGGSPGAVVLPGSERIELDPRGPASPEVGEGEEADSPDGKESTD